MTLDDIPDQHDAFLDRCRTVLNAQITKARKDVDGLNAEKTVAAKALADLQAQHKPVQPDLNSAREYLHRGSTLAGLDHEITAQRKALDALKHEKAELEKAVGALTKQRAALEPQVAALENSARQATAERCRAQE